MASDPDKEKIRLVQGDCLKVLSGLPEGFADAVVTDPPYSSGGMTSSDRTRTTGAKYVQKGTKIQRPDFGGDNRDQRSWRLWCALWIAECYRVAKPDSYFLMFSDWRQLPSATDALQAGGYVWRGIVPWDKTEAARAPHVGYFRHQCEYLVWGTKGSAIAAAAPGGPWPGCYRHSVKQSEKFHQTGKPPQLLKDLLRCVKPGGLVLDPFAGSGTTLVAAAGMGLRAYGIEQSEEYFAIAAKRLDAA
jgi:site-specific DNA-methyltransferase (adenine-specific)